jgi:4-hydroxy-2-oxoheptanedioate aldolase
MNDAPGAAPTIATGLKTMGTMVTTHENCVAKKMEYPFSLGYCGLVPRSLRAALTRGDLVLCLALIHARTPDVPAIAAACGYDAIYVDLEHTSTSEETASMLCFSANGAGIWGLVRAPSHEPATIARILDNGAVGIIVPHVDSKAEAQRVVNAARFPPAGHRSVAGQSLVSGYASLSPAVLERETVVAVMIESPDGVDACDAIAAVDGIDMIVLGPSDLTAEMGIHGQYEHGRFLAAVAAVAAACRLHGVAFGIAGIRSVTQLQHFADYGLRFISAGTDVGMFTEAATSRALELRGLASRHGA